MTRTRSTLAAIVATAALAMLAAPSAEAWPRPPAPLAKGCVKKRAVTFALRRLNACVPPLRVRITSVAGIQPAFVIGTYWCTLANSRPGPPFGTLMSIATAARFCRGHRRGWAYVRIVT